MAEFDLTELTPGELSAIGREAVNHPINIPLASYVVKTALDQAEACMGSPGLFHEGTEFVAVARVVAKSVMRVADKAQVHLYNAQLGS